MKRVNKEDNYEEHIDTGVDQIQPPRQEKRLKTFASTELGDILKQIREKEHLTVEELAKKCDTTPELISGIENKKLNMDLNQLSKIVRLGLDGSLELILKF